VESIEQLLKNESNPEVLRGIALFINEQSQIIAEENKKLRDERAKEQAQKQEWLNNEIRVHLNKLRSRFFDYGRESFDKSYERRTDENQLLMHAKSLVGEVKESEIKKIYQQSRFIAIVHLKIF